MKKRILLVNEAHFINSGFGIIGKELLNRIGDTDKFVLAELACYGEPNDSRKKVRNWQYYPVKPPQTDQAAVQRHAQDIELHWGKEAFHHTVVHFKPDVVIDIRDPWMMRWQNRHPYRRFFYHIQMPTGDSFPYQPEWISDLEACDAVFTYSDYALESLQNQSRKMKLQAALPPGVNTQLFRPLNKTKIRQSFGIQQDAMIVGAVFRNQRRKLVDDLLQGMSIFYQKGDPSIKDKTYLYLHTSYPDLGWELPELIQKYNLSNKVLVTYHCDSCQYFFPSFFQDSKTVCPQCKQFVAIMPNVVKGIAYENLPVIYNFFDLFISCATAGGIELPLLEAAACGIPVTALDFGAPAEVVRHAKGPLIKTSKIYLEYESRANRCYADTSHLAYVVNEFLSLPSQMRIKKGRTAMNNIKKLYNWGTIAGRWIEFLDNIELNQLSWDQPSQVFQGQSEVPDKLNNAELIDYCETNILGPYKLSLFKKLSLLRDLNYGGRMVGRKMVTYNRELLLKEFIEFNQYWNKLEALRLQ